MSSPPTFFDTPGRAPSSELQKQAEAVRSHTCAMPLLDGLPEPAFLLNAQRQIVLANRAGTALAAKLGAPSAVEGLRIGEALECVNVAAGPDGCGTSARCQHCGAGRANKAFSDSAGEYQGEFRLRSVHHGVESAHTFQFHLAPVEMAGSTLRLCSLSDITAAKGREVNDRIFFHDVLNTAQAVHGAADLITGEDDPGTLEELARVVARSSAALVAEIEAQRDLMLAEEGRLEVRREPVAVGALVRDIAALYRQSRFGAGRQIEVVGDPSDDLLLTSPVHLSRSIGNLLKNALEASAPGERVIITVSDEGSHLRIDVRNPAVMPDAVQAQVFQRFFSTKASSGRGLGTYSVRLLVTGLLGGTVAFTSTPGDGTTFTIRLPK